jgi:hypothetical protein
MASLFGSFGDEFETEREKDRDGGGGGDTQSVRSARSQTSVHSIPLSVHSQHSHVSQHSQHSHVSQHSHLSQHSLASSSVRIKESLQKEKTTQDFSSFFPSDRDRDVEVERNQVVSSLTAFQPQRDEQEEQNLESNEPEGEEGEGGGGGGEALSYLAWLEEQSNHGSVSVCC